MPPALLGYSLFLVVELAVHQPIRWCLSICLMSDCCELLQLLLSLLLYSYSKHYSHYSLNILYDWLNTLFDWTFHVKKQYMSLNIPCDWTFYLTEDFMWLIPYDKIFRVTDLTLVWLNIHCDWTFHLIKRSMSLNIPCERTLHLTKHSVWLNILCDLTFHVTKHSVTKHSMSLNIPMWLTNETHITLTLRLVSQC